MRSASFRERPLLGTVARPLLLAAAGTWTAADRLHRTPKVIAPESVDSPVVATGFPTAGLSDEDARRLLRVLVDGQDRGADEQLAVSGRYRVGRGSLTFIPDLPFAAGQPYRVECSAAPDGAAVPVVARFRLGADPVVARFRPDVVAVYPSSGPIPETSLRFYVQFSGDMRGRFRRRDVRLADEHDREIKDAFVSFGQELWSPDGTRLTLLLHPGRLKRGVAATAVVGAPLRAGGRYSLTVEVGRSPSSRGDAAIDSYQASYDIGDPLRTSIDPRRWAIGRPRVGSVERLDVEFDRVMDHALLQLGLVVEDHTGRRVPGAGLVGPHERSWSFAPAAAWSVGAHQLRAAAVLEDVSGNRVGEPLDRDLTDPRNASAPSAVPFIVR